MIPPRAAITTVRYSVCITCHNEAKTVRQSLDSILDQIDNRFEVIVVDSLSNDGSIGILSEYERHGRIRLILKKCGRGAGRQIAFENSSGKYIISNMDLDDVFKPVLKELLSLYHAKFEGHLLYVNKPPDWGGITIGTRELIGNIGGWRDLQFAEDWDLWARAAKIGKFKALSYEFRQSIGAHPELQKSVYKRLRYRYNRYRDLYRLGRKVFAKNERVTVLQKLMACLAYMTSSLHPSFRDSFNEGFDPWEYIDLG